MMVSSAANFSAADVERSAGKSMSEHSPQSLVDEDSFDCGFCVLVLGLSLGRDDCDRLRLRAILK